MEKLDQFAFLIDELEKMDIDQDNPHIHFLKEFHEVNQEFAQSIEQMGKVIKFGYENAQLIPHNETKFFDPQYFAHKQFIEKLNNAIESI